MAKPLKSASRRFRPAGWPRVIPRLLVADPQAAVAFLKRTFGAKGRYQVGMPTELRIGESVLLVSDASARRPTAACIYVYVENADATYRRALRDGARSIEEPALMPYGDRRAMVEDAWGNTWQIATRAGLRDGRPRARARAS